MRKFIAHIILYVGIFLFSCSSFELATKRDTYGTGTANEPGTRVNPYLGMDPFKELVELPERDTIFIKVIPPEHNLIENPDQSPWKY